MKVTKTQVSFGLKRNFAFVWLPQMYSKRRPEESVTLTFDLPKRVRDKQIADATEIVPGRWVHHVVVTGPGDITGKVRKWLRAAYEWRAR